MTGSGNRYTHMGTSTTAYRGSGDFGLLRNDQRRRLRFGGTFLEDASGERQVVNRTGTDTRRLMGGGALDAAQHFPGHPLEPRARTAADLGQELLQFAAKALRRRRGG